MKKLAHLVVQVWLFLWGVVVGVLRGGKK